MSSDSRFLAINASRANHDTVDGETLVLDPTTGVLTMIGGIGALVWERLVVGVERHALLEELDHAYGEVATVDAAQFLDELVASELVVETDSVASSTTTVAASWPPEYKPPSIERYDEIADIMTMDPIHEVDPSLGWPNAASDPGSSASAPPSA